MQKVSRSVCGPTALDSGCGTVKESFIPGLCSHNKRHAVLISRVVHWVKVSPPPLEGRLGSSVCVSPFE